MKIQLQKISKKLKNLREEKKLTQEELAKHLGVSRQSIIALEQGRCLPSLPLAINFSEIFHLPFESIFAEAEIIQQTSQNMREEVKQIMSNDLSPWTPIGEAKGLHEAIDRLFTSNAENWSAEKATNLPAINIYEKAKNVIVQVDVPGIKEEDLSVEAGEDTLTIIGQRKSENEVKETDFYRKETFFGQFSRTVQLPAIVDKEKTQAELNNGQLIVILPKKSKVKPKITKVKVKKV